MTITSSDSNSAHLVDETWVLRVGRQSLLIRPSSVRDLPALARMHSRCSARSLLDRYRAGGRPPTVAALDSALRRPLGIVAVTPTGDVVASGSLGRDPAHSERCAEVGLLIEDSWQGLGIGRELITHLAGVAQVVGFHELIAYPATAVVAAQRLMLEIGRTRQVPDTDLHLHTFVPDSAALGLGAVRQRLAG